VVTGIGHEPDTSIADMVADVRASTPTAAAEAASPSNDQLNLMLSRERRALATALQNRVKAASHQVLRLAERPVLRDPHAVLGPAVQAIDMAGMRLARAIPERLARDGQLLTYARDRLLRAGPALVEGARGALAVGAARLEDLSPLGILARGYAICFAGDGSAVVKSISGVKRGDAVVVRVLDGSLGATVTDLIQLEER
jgi:exodeoxyribonuclease VII large subunit